jgi:hypothetical protein
MSEHARLRWGGVALGGLALALFAYGGLQDVESESLLVDVLGAVAFASPALVGTYLIWRLPENAVGWILAGFGLSFTLGVMGETIGTTSNPAASWFAWLSTWQWAALMVLILVFLPLRFPDGKAPSPRYRWVTPVALGGLILVILGNAFRESTGLASAEGPVVVELPTPLPLSAAAFDALAVVGLVLMLAAVCGAIGASITRYRASVGIERQQMKVFVGSLIFATLGMALNLVLYEIGFAFADGLFALMVLVLVASIAVAVLRYRLYEFDRLISRTVSYALLVLILGAVYAFGAIWLPARVLGYDSPVFVAASTLVIAAIFNPIRRRVMTWVDRRFNRSRYRLELIMDDFAGTLRDQVDVDRMTAEWVGLVTETLQPSTAGVWVRT